MWRDLIGELCPDAAFEDPTDREAIERASTALGQPLPDLLVALLLETNGVTGEYGLGLVWPVERIVEENLALRADEGLRDLYMPFDPLLFFADAGNGDLFAVPRTPLRDDVFVWEHESDSRRWAARDIEWYLRWTFDGTLTT